MSRHRWTCHRVGARAFRAAPGWGALILAAAGWGYASELDPTLDLWPLCYYESGRTGTTEVLWPIFERTRDAHQRDTVLRPLWRSRTHSEHDRHWASVLWPLVFRSMREGPRTDATFLLLSSFTRDRGPTASKPLSLTIFPLIFKETSREFGGTFAFWPLYGRFQRRFGHDRIHFVLWPIYTRMDDEEEGGTRTTWNTPWPIISFSRLPGGSGWRVWPLYGRRHKEGAYDKRFVLWPFYIAVDARLRDAGSYRARMYWPFYGWERSPHADSKTWLWPFVWHTANYRDKSDTWSYFWPLIGKRRGENEDVDKWLPLYRWRVNRRRGTSQLVILYPFYWSDKLSGEDYMKQSTWLVPIYHRVRERWVGAGKVATYTQIWPLFRWQRTWQESNPRQYALHVSLFSLWPYRDVANVERTYGPFLLFIAEYRREANGDTLTHFLWRVFRHRHTRDGYFTQIWPLVAFGRGKGASRFALLQGLFELRRNEKGRYLKLLYLPMVRISGP